jgi:hypothetical protein
MSPHYLPILLQSFTISDCGIFLTLASQHSPETSSGIVTSWLAVTTAWPTQAGCSSALWNVWSTAIVAFDPGYSLSVDKRSSCLPPAAMSWWEQDHSTHTGMTLSLGLLVCPQAYTTASSSEKHNFSTFIACCPSYVEFL